MCDASPGSPIAVSFCDRGMTLLERLCELCESAKATPLERECRVALESMQRTLDCNMRLRA